MKLEQFPELVAKAAADMATQDAYVQALGIKYQNGETTIEVFSDNVWTTVLLKDFWEMQHAKYLAMSKYAGELNGLLTNLQTVMDTALENIVKPDDYVKAQAA